MFNSLEVALSDTKLTSLESAGGICPSYFGDRRQHQVPSDWPSPVLRFLAPRNDTANLRQVAKPQPSARRPFRMTAPAKRRAQGDDGAMSPTAA
jgi:hypothetical protein